MPAGSYEWPEADLRPFMKSIDNSLLKYQQAVNMAAVGWMPLGATDPTPGWLRPTIDLEVERIVADVKRASDRYSIKRPLKWSTDVPALPSFTRAQLELYYGHPVRFVTGIDPAAWDASIINERSKPMGLTNRHEYESPRKSGRKLSITKSHFEEGVYITATRYDECESTWVAKSDTVPLALNVLGYDRPDAKPYAAGPTTYNGKVANRDIPSTESVRDAHVAEAVDLLRGASIFDQRAAARSASAEAAAKRDAEHAKRKAIEEAAAKAARAAVAEREIAERFFRKAKDAYSEAVAEQFWRGIDAESAAKVQSALSSYETARRKVEGLPN